MTIIEEIGACLSNLESWKTPLPQHSVVEKSHRSVQWVNSTKLDSSNHAGFPVTILDLRSQKHFSSNENTGTQMVIFKAVWNWLEMSCCGHGNERWNTVSVILKVLEGKYVQCTITPGYSMSPGLWKPTFFFFYLSLAVVISCLKDCLSHRSFVLVSRQMLPNPRTGTCSISKFPPHNLGQHAIFFLQLSYSCLQLPNIGQGWF